MPSLFCATRPIILASQSPRRQSFLRELGIEFVLPSMYLKNGANENFACEHFVGESFSGESFAGESSAYGGPVSESPACESPVSEHSVCVSNISKSNGFGGNKNIADKTQGSAIRTHGVFAKDDGEERPKPFELPRTYVERMALTKCHDVLNQLGFLKENESLHSRTGAYEHICETQGRNGHDYGVKERFTLSYEVGRYPFKACSSDNNTYSFSDRACIIAADTIVALGDEILGKPHDEADASVMLRRMVGRNHTVLTSVCVADVAHACVYIFTDTAEVHFAPWSQELLEAYIRTGDPMDKAGSYGIQGIGMFLSDGIKGSWDTVAGLPVAKLLELLMKLNAVQVSD